MAIILCNAITLTDDSQYHQCQAQPTLEDYCAYHHKMSMGLLEPEQTFQGPLPVLVFHGKTKANLWRVDDLRVAR